MIVVPSISPTTISAERARRRRTLRTPSLSSTRFRTARTPTAPPTAASASARTMTSVSIGMPKSSFMFFS